MSEICLLEGEATTPNLPISRYFSDICSDALTAETHRKYTTFTKQQHFRGHVQSQASTLYPLSHHKSPLKVVLLQTHGSNMTVKHHNFYLLLRTWYRRRHISVEPKTHNWHASVQLDLPVTCHWNFLGTNITFTLNSRLVLRQLTFISVWSLWCTPPLTWREI